MWVKNSWYVAGFCEEIGHKLLARRFLNQAVILWRTTEGKVVAMADRCPHRLVPLSLGGLVNNQVQCGYHGLQFDAQGACSHVPGQDTLPKNAKVTTFPVAERHGLVWIWLGAADLADAALVPDVHWMDCPGWTASKGYLHFKADYRLITDNLLDLSHETYIHKETIGNSAVADAPVLVKVEQGRFVRAHREMPNIDPPPFFAMMLNHTGKINRWQVATYMPPGINMTEAGVHPVGSDRGSGCLIRPLHLLTPETEHTSHYFWGVCRNFHTGDGEMTESIRKATAHTFSEDREMLEIQDRCLQDEGMPALPQAAVKVDIAPVQGRRLLADLIAKEAADPRAVVPPVAMADDNKLTQPFAA